MGTFGKNADRLLAAPQPNSEVRNADTYGVLKLTLHKTSYDWEFVPEDSGHGSATERGLLVATGLAQG